MAEKTEEQACMRGKTVFTDGTKLCLLNKCMTCDDGEWSVERIEPDIPLP